MAPPDGPAVGLSGLPAPPDSPRVLRLDQGRATMSTLVGPLIAFSGSRDFADRSLVERVMRRLVKRYPVCLIRVGDARGLDLMVGKEATRWGKWPDVQKCCWPPPGSTRQERWKAAHERNSRVVRDADMLIAFYSPGPKSPGTTDAIKQATARGIPIHVYHEGRWEKMGESA